MYCGSISCRFSKSQDDNAEIVADSVQHTRVRRWQLRRIASFICAGRAMLAKTRASRPAAFAMMFTACAASANDIGTNHGDATLFLNPMSILPSYI